MSADIEKLKSEIYETCNFHIETEWDLCKDLMETIESCDDLMQKKIAEDNLAIRKGRYEVVLGLSEDIAEILDEGKCST